MYYNYREIEKQPGKEKCRFLCELLTTTVPSKAFQASHLALPLGSSMPGLCIHCWGWGGGSVKQSIRPEGSIIHVCMCVFIKMHLTTQPGPVNKSSSATVMDLPYRGGCPSHQLYYNLRKKWRGHKDPIWSVVCWTGRGHDRKITPE